jgi:hypothetical protein
MRPAPPAGQNGSVQRTPIFHDVQRGSGSGFLRAPGRASLRGIMRLLLPLRQLSLARRLLAMLATPLAVGVWERTNHSDLVFYALCVSAFALHLRSLGAQLAVRSLLVLSLFVGVLNGAKPFGIVAVGVALLALGRAGLGEHPGSKFVPIKGRSALLAMLVIGLMQIELLLALVVRHADPFLHGRRVAFDLGWTVFVGLGLWGVFRLRVWGLLVLPFAGALVAALGSLGSHRLFGVVVLPLSDICGFPWLGIHTAALMIPLAAAQIACSALVLRRALSG